MTTEETHLEKMLSYNWDSGFDGIEEILSLSSCTYNIALLAFWLADGYGFLTAPDDYNDDCWDQRMCAWRDRLLSNHYPVGQMTVNLPLTKVQIYQLSKTFPDYPKTFWLGNPHH